MLIAEESIEGIILRGSAVFLIVVLFLTPYFQSLS